MPPSGYKVSISLKRVQTFIFDVPRLRAMLGANALVGETMRHELRCLMKVMGSHGSVLSWPDSVNLIDSKADPLADPADSDKPKELFMEGILARDGGHFVAVFPDEPTAKNFITAAKSMLASRLPGVLFDAPPPIPFGQKPDDEKAPGPPCEVQLLDLPVFQVCQETGQQAASKKWTVVADEPERFVASSVLERVEAGNRFYSGETQDIIGLLYSKLYSGWCLPVDLKDLANGDYIALIHADGNNIGQRSGGNRNEDSGAGGTGQTPDANAVDPIEEEARCQAFFHSMRVSVRKALVEALNETFKPAGFKPGKSGKPTCPFQILMLGGDDLLLVCRARNALKFAERYASALQKHKLTDGRPLDVAIGVAIARHTYPIHRLHELAEALAGSAKVLARSNQGGSSVVDWQIVTQSWFGDLRAARRGSDLHSYTVNGRQETLLLSGRPYTTETLGRLNKAASALEAGSQGGADKVDRSPLRGLRAACEQGRLAGEMAFDRLDKGTREILRDKDKLFWDPVPVPSGGNASQSQERVVYRTDILDIIDIYEISHLGKKQEDAPRA